MSDQLTHQRFDKHWIPEPNCGCWFWTGATTGKGYGHFKFRGGCWQAHRVSWVLHNGEIPDGMHVCHSCDTPGCVNPDHLFVGTNCDNVADRVAKGRSARSLGEDNPRALLKPADVLKIRRSKEKLRVLAEKYGVGIGTISAVRTGRNWQSI